MMIQLRMRVSAYLCGEGSRRKRDFTRRTGWKLSAVVVLSPMTRPPPCRPPGHAPAPTCKCSRTPPSHPRFSAVFARGHLFSMRGSPERAVEMLPIPGRRLRESALRGGEASSAGHRSCCIWPRATLTAKHPAKLRQERTRDHCLSQNNSRFPALGKFLCAHRQILPSVARQPSLVGHFPEIQVPKAQGLNTQIPILQFTNSDRFCLLR